MKKVLSGSGNKAHSVQRTQTLTDKDIDVFADELTYGNLELIAILPDKTEFTTPVIDDKGEPEEDQRVFPDMMRVLLRDHNAITLRTKMTDESNPAAIPEYAGSLKWSAYGTLIHKDDVAKHKLTARTGNARENNIVEGTRFRATLGTNMGTKDGRWDERLQRRLAPVIEYFHTTNIKVHNTPKLAANNTPAVTRTRIASNSDW